MVKQQIKEDFYLYLLNLNPVDDLYVLWEIIKKDDTLCPILRTKAVDVYYRGHKLISVMKGKVKCKVSKFKNKLYMYEISDNPTTKQIIEELPLYKQMVDLWFGAGMKSPYEREFSQLILRENNSKKLGRYSDYFIVDMEHKYKDSKNAPLPDLIAIKKGRNDRHSKVCRLAIIEVKYMDDAFSGDAGIGKHIDDYVDLISDISLLAGVKVDIEEMYKQSKKLNLIHGFNKDTISISNEVPELIFALISRNTNNGKGNTNDKKETLKKILSDAKAKHLGKLDSVYIAQTAELGFGLYEDRLTHMDDFLNIL